MPLVKESDKKVILERFKQNLKRDVELGVFGYKDGCPYWKETLELMEETAGFSEKIRVTTFTFESEPQVFQNLRVEMVPSIVFLGEVEGRIRFYGFPAGYTYKALIDDIIWVSRGSTDLAEETRNRLRELDFSANVATFVTGQCVSCMRMVKLIHQMALESRNIRAEVVDVDQFPKAAEPYGATAVTPVTVVNRRLKLFGAWGELKLAEYLLGAPR